MATLYVVATPIGNLDDISFRAIEVLRSVHVVAAEDTRHSRRLLKRYHIQTPLISYHAHNENTRTIDLMQRLKKGQSVALISDAGTPLISDPGDCLIKAAHAEKIKVVPIPGACAAIAALSVSGLSCENFMFQGFLPAIRTARQTVLASLRYQRNTLIFYEAPHRLEKTLTDLLSIFGKQRQITLARELTKTFETVYTADIQTVYLFVKNNLHQQKGECVLIVAGCPPEDVLEDDLIQVNKILNSLLSNLPLKKAVKITTELINVPKNTVYQMALEIKNHQEKYHESKI